MGDSLRLKGDSLNTTSSFTEHGISFFSFLILNYSDPNIFHQATATSKEIVVAVLESNRK
jgi:hypothetical protein